MGSNTQFQGVLNFTYNLSDLELEKLTNYLDLDCRKIKDYNFSEYSSYIDLELSKDSKGLKYNGSEKSSLNPSMVNYIINKMQKEFPNFGLQGSLLAQGDEIGDIWILYMENNIAKRKSLDVEKILNHECPNCGYKF